VQNFAAIGPQSSEITRREKKEKNKPQQNFSPLPQAIAYGRTKKQKLAHNKQQCENDNMMYYLYYKADENTAEVLRTNTILKLAESFNKWSTLDVTNRASKLTVAIHSKKYWLYVNI